MISSIIEIQKCTNILKVLYLVLKLGKVKLIPFPLFTDCQISDCEEDVDENQIQPSETDLQEMEAFCRQTDGEISEAKLNQLMENVTAKMMDSNSQSKAKGGGHKLSHDKIDQSECDSFIQSDNLGQNDDGSQSSSPLLNDKEVSDPGPRNVEC